MCVDMVQGRIDRLPKGEFPIRKPVPVVLRNIFNSDSAEMAAFAGHRAGRPGRSGRKWR